MLIVIAFALGCLVGWRRAATRGGDRLDLVQYGAVHGIAFALAALALAVLIDNIGLV